MMGVNLGECVLAVLVATAVLGVVLVDLGLFRLRRFVHGQ